MHYVFIVVQIALYFMSVKRGILFYLNFLLRFENQEKTLSGVHTIKQ